MLLKELMNEFEITNLQKFTYFLGFEFKK